VPNLAGETEEKLSELSCSRGLHYEILDARKAGASFHSPIPTEGKGEATKVQKFFSDFFFK